MERIGFLSCFATHQLLSGSKEQTAIALWIKGRVGQTSILYIVPLSSPSSPSPFSIDGWHSPCTACHGKFILERAPADKGGRTVDAQQHERRLPDDASRKRVGCLLPHIGISIL